MRALFPCLLLTTLLRAEPGRPSAFTQLLRDPGTTGTAIHLENGELCRVRPGSNEVVVTTRRGQKAIRKTIKSTKGIHSCAIASDGRVAFAAPALLIVEDPARETAKPLPLGKFSPVRVHFDHEGQLWVVGYLDVDTPEQDNLIVWKYNKDLSAVSRLSIPFSTGEDDAPHPSALVHVASGKSDFVVLSPLRNELVLIARDNATATGVRHQPLPQFSTPSLITGLAATAEGVLAISVQESRKDGNWYRLLRWEPLQRDWLKIGEPTSQPRILLGAQGDSLMLFRPPNYEWLTAR
jgi:hypothetical protein